MNYKMDKIENNVVKFEITVEVGQFNQALTKAFKKNANKFNIPGFRKGKAPIHIVKKYYGEGVLFEDAINICCEDTYPKVLEESKVRPVDYPEIDIVQIGEGKEFIYTAKITTYPEVELGQYKGVEVKKVEYTVSAEEIENHLKSMQQKNARIETKAEGTIENGNIAVIDFKGFVDGVAFEGGSGTDYSLEIGSGTFIGDFENQLVGAAVGETKNVSVEFPVEYGKEDLNGKPAVFEVTVKEIKVKELPALDNEFAKEVSEFDTIDELKADITKKLQEGNDLKAKREYEDAVVEAVCANAKVDIPAVMIDKEIETMLKDFEMRLKYQGLDLNTYYEYTNNSELKMKEFMKDGAEKRVKTELVMGKLAEVETMEVTDEEMLAKATEIAKQYGQEDLEKTAKLIVDSQGQYIKANIINEKLIDMLVENSKEVA